MSKKMTRGKKAGRRLGRVIVEMAQLMYQENTKKHFFQGLITVLKQTINEGDKDAKEM